MRMMHQPWRILDECRAFNHNTASAGRGYNTVEKCVCPGAVLLVKQQNEEVVRRQRARRAGRVAIPAWWTGPWRILDECPATGHNALTRATRPVDGLKCICPHARDLFAIWLKDKRERSRVASSEGPPNVRTLAPKDNRLHRSPDYSKAACQTPEARMIFDEAFSAADTIPGEMRKNRARAICRICPVRRQCRAWALAEERPCGSWGGVWGGLDPRQRVNWPKPQDASAS